MKTWNHTAGMSDPLGATATRDGVNFSIFSRSATVIELLLFDEEQAAEPSRVVALDAHRHRTYHYWHVFVPDLQPGQVYGYRAHGPFAPERGLRFDPQKVLVDPYGLAVAVPASYDRGAAIRHGDNCATAMKSVVVAPAAYDWEEDRPLRRPFTRTIIYEMHVRGFTQHPSSAVADARRGTYAGVIDKIPYLQDLGITAVELLPIFQFDSQDAPDGRCNYWGYQPVSFFAPHQAYSSRPDALGALDEFRDMVKALHRAGIEVILDVVFNHTTEAGQTGPTLCYRGLANDVYYTLQPDKSLYADFSGCGNTLNANQPIVRRLIQDSLRYWVTQMHVDGFRDDVRQFWKSNDRTGPALATRLLGSPDLFAHEEREPEQSINFVTCHDGFTLNDLVSYNRKHNEANGEQNRDGTNDDSSWNCGVEGPTDDPEVEALRDRQMKNFLTVLMLAAGTPMLLMGDEIRRSQGGNNNAYCVDDEANWLDWRLLERHAGLHRFVKHLTALRLRPEIVDESKRLSLNQLLQWAHIEWHGVALGRPDWSDGSHSLAFTARTPYWQFAVHGMFNAYWEPLTFELPSGLDEPYRWQRCVDTALPSPVDICMLEEAPPVSESYRVQPRSCVVLVSLLPGAGTSAGNGR
jgi:pullulanase/glycogen debranching enzyme